MVDWKKYWAAIGVGELIVIGALLFFFPEPTTSIIGIALIATAVVVWLAGWLRGDDNDGDEYDDEYAETETTY
ncbi:hypothetical protein [Halopelagius fulvigenes]|uniref:Uncharacterized protein n=1 Tax=Halopelagius fulvigenes TaxID=1198324 RepID=A0ABD5U1B0_9EURY